MKKKKDEEKLENYFDVFMRNYKTVPGFKILVKFGLYFIFFAVIILTVVISKANTPKTNNNENQTTTTLATKVETISYKEILDNLTKNAKKINCEATINEINYSIDADIKNSIISGYVQKDNSTFKFKIQDGSIYEINLKEEIKNPNILEGLSLNFLIPANITNLLSHNLSTKMIEDDKTIYEYKIKDNGINYIIVVNVLKNTISNINITGNGIVYNINYQ